MKPEVVALCEYASENNGRLTIVDTFDVIVAMKFPWRAYFYAVSKINIMECPIEYKSITMTIVNSKKDDQPIFEAKSPFSKEKNLDKLNIVAGFKGLIFESSGDYIFRIALDDDIIVDYPFKVIEKKNE